MEAIGALYPKVRFHIVTLIPEWLFTSSLTCDFTYHARLTDVGLVQTDPLREDLSETLKTLAQFMPFPPERVKSAAGIVRDGGCSLVISDIAPLGIAAAREAGVASVLVENFLWDWIYEGYTELDARFAEYAAYTGELFASADYHIQTEPVCCGCHASLTTPPISRSTRLSPREVRGQLSLAEEKKIVVITMGGVPCEYEFLSRLRENKQWHFVIPGGGDLFETRDNVTLIPRQADLYHPDLINAASAVIGKVGYSTLAECYHAGVPFGYIGRSAFRESVVLMAYIKAEMPGRSIPGEMFSSGEWLKDLPWLLEQPILPRGERNGASQVARFILGIAGVAGSIDSPVE